MRIVPHKAALTCQAEAVIVVDCGPSHVHRYIAVWQYAVVQHLDGLVDMFVVFAHD
jgi:hypothetical protein